jgi:hypothetical protein
MRAILIDPKNQIISVIQLDDNDTLASKVKWMECDRVDCINLGKVVDLWVDDEGLMWSREDHQYFVLHVNGKGLNLVAGRAVVCGLNPGTGDTIALPDAITPLTMLPFVAWVPHNLREEAADIAEAIVGNTDVASSEEEANQLRAKHEALVAKALALTEINLVTLSE